MVKQLSVFVENKTGRLAEVMSLIAQAKINVQALSIADTADFGILRLIVDNAESAKELLKVQGLTVKVTEVLAVALEDKPGSLASTLCTLSDIGASIEYIYASTSHSHAHEAMAIISISNPAELLEKLHTSNLKLLTEQDIKNV